MSTGDGGSGRPWEPQRIPVDKDTTDTTDTSGASSVPAAGGPFKKSTLVKLGVTAAVVGAGVWIFTAVDDDEEPTHAAVCVDQETGNRVDDNDCNNNSGGHSHFGWFFFAYGHSAPRVGAPVPVGSGSYTPPNGSYVKGGVPRAGGVVNSSSVKGGTTTTNRGGFGTTSKGSGG